MDTSQPATEAQPGQKTSGMAIASLILAIILPPVGLILGIIVLVQMKNDPSKGGKGLAIAGVVIGAIWSFFFILAFIGGLAYFGVLSPAKFVPERTVFQAPIPNTDVAFIETDGILVYFRNNAGQSIQIKSKGTTTGGCGNVVELVINDLRFADMSEPLENGESISIKWECTNALKSGDTYAGDLGFSYLSESGLERRHQGSVDGKVR